MQRFRLMNFYSAVLVFLMIVVIASVAWFRRLVGGAERTAADAPIATTEATQPATQPTSSPAAAAQEVKVSIDNFAFKPKELSIPVGGTVTWVNRDDVPHTATSAGEPTVFDSKALDTDDKFSFTFTRPGTYNYYCKVHTHMTGTVVVK